VRHEQLPEIIYSRDSGYRIQDSEENHFDAEALRRGGLHNVQKMDHAEKSLEIQRVLSPRHQERQEILIISLRVVLLRASASNLMASSASRKICRRLLNPES
jgi:hypothetical protein